MNNRARERRVIFVFILIFSVAILLKCPISFQENVWQKHRRQVAAPVPPPIRTCWEGIMCSRVVTGTAGGTWIITGAKGTLGNIQNYHTANMDQIILARTDTSVTVKLEARTNLDTRAVFPLDTNRLPADVLPYLQATSNQQSNHPAVISQARTLIGKAETEAQAVVAILDWVRAHIAYDFSFLLPTDAVSVYNNRSGVCAGFSNLSVALLRAVGIPAKVQEGCALWSFPSGGGHAWIEVYYSDLGWVPSEPQSSENFVDMHLVTPRWWEWCGQSSTNITYTELIRPEIIYSLKTPYQDDIFPYVESANIATWDRHPLQVTPNSPSLMLPITNPIGCLSLQVENLNCEGQDWEIRTTASWLSPVVMTGTATGIAQFTVDASGMHTGFYSSPMTLSGIPLWWGDPIISRTITANLWLVDRVYYSYLPLVARNNLQ